MSAEFDDSDNPIIVLPGDPVWHDLLFQRQTQLSEWITSRIDKNIPPETVITTVRGYSHRLLMEIREYGQVNIERLSEILSKQQGESFNSQDFYQACKIVNLYTSNMGALREEVKMVDTQRTLRPTN